MKGGVRDRAKTMAVKPRERQVWKTGTKIKETGRRGMGGLRESGKMRKRPVHEWDKCGRKEEMSKRVRGREKRCRTRWLPVKMESSGNHFVCTCARSIISGVYFDGVGSVGPLLGQVSVGRTIQAAVTHSIHVAAICLNTTSC